MTDTAETNTPAVADKRDELRAKIEASERRIEQRTLADQAKEAAGAATNYAREHPLTVLGGAIAVGLVVGAMTSRGRRAARGAAVGTVNAVNSAARSTKDAVGNASTKQVSRFGTLLADAITAYGIKLIDDALDTAQAGQDKLEDLGDSASSKARQLRRDAEYYAGTAADKGKQVTRRTRRRAGRAVRDLKDKVTS
ncbi:hypothetical protein [Erythrobacter rubeus]|uniref:DUF883 domain-containing protein n=1 Tax=Erythrobacter rubeus TaxID=2760803 RepID=A0ABR8KMU5_9SPHN|nr:hypothetical protein [Erythrobacter rubeus]MBD2841914.1 hypothetical protein [Erythrobacter rubeus]